MENFLELEVIEVTQNIGTLYLSKIEGNELYKLAKADIMRITENQDYEGIQRELDNKRVKYIKEYLKTDFASFPNTIILNINSENIIESYGNYMKISRSSNVFTIIDGQHRLSGFRDGDINGFEVPISIFIDLDITNQALLFSTINSEQKKVDPSLKLNLEKYSNVNTPKKSVTQLSYAFNMDDNSPWKGRIKLTGRKDSNSSYAIIAHKTFAQPIIDYIYDDNDNYKIRNALLKNEFINDIEYENEKYIFWKFYKNNKMEIVYKILLNYFNCFQKILEVDWGNSKSILTKSTGYNAIMTLFKLVFIKCNEMKDFSEDNMYDILKPLSELSEKLTSEQYGGSGMGSSNSLYKVMRDKINL